VKNVEGIQMRAKHKQEYASVPMPSSGVSINKVGKYQYVYHIGKGYRNAKGQPTNDKTGIGKVAEDGRLIPNDNYYAIYENRAPPLPMIEVDSIVNFGDFFLMDRIARDIGLSRVLSNVYGEMGDEILILAIYMALTGQALYRCDGWQRETLTGRDGKLSSQRCSRVLKALDETRRMDFFRAWALVRQQHEYLAYDVTSVSSHSRGNELVEHGYNRDGEDMAQINLGMYYGEESGLPIFYCTYKGSIVDKSHLPYMMQYNERLGIKDVCFVMDRGFFSESNVRWMAHKHRFIMGISNSLRMSKDIIADYGEQVMSSRYDIGLSGANGISIDDDRYEFRSKIHLYYSIDKLSDEGRIFREKLAKWEEDLREGKNVKAAEDYFHVDFDSDKETMVVTRNHAAIDEKLRNMGYFLMMTTDLNRSASEVLDIYRKKDLIEKCFDELKNDLDMKRLRVHSNVAADGKMFIAFIGLILRTYVHQKLKDYIDSKRPISMAQIFDELRMIKTVKTTSGMWLHNPLTKRQRTILEQFEITETCISSAIYKYTGVNPFFEE
jgi:transposase